MFRLETQKRSTEAFRAARAAQQRDVATTNQMPFGISETEAGIIIEDTAPSLNRAATAKGIGADEVGVILETKADSPQTVAKGPSMTQTTSPPPYADSITEPDVAVDTDHKASLTTSVNTTQRTIPPQPKATLAPQPKATLPPQPKATLPPPRKATAPPVTTPVEATASSATSALTPPTEHRPQIPKPRPSPSSDTLTPWRQATMNDVDAPQVPVMTQGSHSNEGNPTNPAPNATQATPSATNAPRPTPATSEAAPWRSTTASELVAPTLTRQVPTQSDVLAEQASSGERNPPQLAQPKTDAPWRRATSQLIANDETQSTSQDSAPWRRPTSQVINQETGQGLKHGNAPWRQPTNQATDAATTSPWRQGSEPSGTPSSALPPWRQPSQAGAAQEGSGDLLQQRLRELRSHTASQSASAAEVSKPRPNRRRSSRLDGTNVPYSLKPGSEGVAHIPPLVATLLELGFSKATGALDGATSDTQWTVFLRQGAVTGVEIHPPRPHERIGQLLMASTELTEDELEEGLEEAEAQELRLGQALVDMDYVEPREVSQVLTERARARLVEFTTHSEINTMFRPGVTLGKSGLTSGLPVPATLFNAKFQRHLTRSYDEMRDCDTPFQGRILTRNVKRLPNLRLDKRDKLLWKEVIIGKFTLGEAYGLSPVDRRRTHAMIHALHELGLLIFTKTIGIEHRVADLRNDFTKKATSLQSANPFDALELHWSATQREVNDAFKKLRRQYSATQLRDGLKDANADAIAELEALSERIQTLLSEAHMTLETHAARAACRANLVTQETIKFSAGHYLKQGKAAAFQNETLNAIMLFEKVLELEPGQPDALGNLHTLARRHH